jgi:hypothetical protein
MPYAPRREPLEALARFLSRSALLAFWSFVLWGTLLDVVLVFDLVTAGPASVVPALVSRPRADVALAWGNRVAGFLAPVVWLLVLAAVRSRARERSSSGTPGC